MNKSVGYLKINRIQRLYSILNVNYEVNNEQITLFCFSNESFIREFHICSDDSKIINWTIISIKAIGQWQVCSSTRLYTRRLVDFRNVPPEEFRCYVIILCSRCMSLNVMHIYKQFQYKQEKNRNWLQQLLSVN